MDLRCVDGGKMERWRGGVTQSTYVDSGGEGGGQAGVTVGVLNTLCKTSVGTHNDNMIQITRWVGDQADETVRLLANTEFSGSLSNLHISFCSHFLLHT
jgi:hypothetical protein